MTDSAAVTSKRTGDEACTWELINRTDEESLHKNAQYAGELIVEFHLNADRDTEIQRQTLNDIPIRFITRSKQHAIQLVL